MSTFILLLHLVGDPDCMQTLKSLILLIIHFLYLIAARA